MQIIMIKKYFSRFITSLLIIAPLLANATEDITIKDPLGLTSPFDLYGRLIRGFTAVMGAVALFFFILGGFKWLTSGGNDEKVKKGRDTLIWATLGLAVILSSYIILSYVIATLKTAVGTP